MKTIPISHNTLYNYIQTEQNTDHTVTWNLTPKQIQKLGLPYHCISLWIGKPNTPLEHKITVYLNHNQNVFYIQAIKQNNRILCKNPFLVTGYAYQKFPDEINTDYTKIKQPFAYGIDLEIIQNILTENLRKENLLWNQIITKKTASASHRQI